MNSSLVPLKTHLVEGLMDVKPVFEIGVHLRTSGLHAVLNPIPGGLGCGRRRKWSFFQSAERHDGDWLLRGEPGGVPKISSEWIFKKLTRLRAKRMLSRWSIGKVNIDSDWLPRGLRIGKWEELVQWGNLEIKVEEKFKERMKKFNLLGCNN
ncbi:hypothetical protein TNCV_2535811 [Trichonephila clavipes]|nr:hypothetical protein TNCV_2535811 [Trichonephila clavipes]